MKGLDAHFDRQLSEYQRRIDEEADYEARLERYADEEREEIEEFEEIEILINGANTGDDEAAQIALYEMIYADKGNSTERFNEAAKGFVDALTDMIDKEAERRSQKRIEREDKDNNDEKGVEHAYI